MSFTVLTICDHAWVNGGQSKVAIDGAVGLARAGHRSIYFAPAGPVDEQLKDAGVEVHCLGQQDILGNSSRIKAAVDGLWNRQAAAALRRLLLSLPEDCIVHVHGWAKAASPSIASVLNQSGKHVVYTLHEFFLVCPNGSLYRYPKGQNCQLKPMSLACIVDNCDARHYAHKVWRVARQGALHVLGGWPRKLAHVIYISHLQRDVMAPHFSPDTRLHHVPNAINVQQKPYRDERDIDALFVGRFSPEKGTLLLAEAARKSGVKITFVGGGYYEEKLVSEFPEAELLGWQTPEQVMELMARSRVLVFPSHWYEGQPLTVIEALANGTPVIVSDNCAGREAIADGETGLWFKSGDVDDLVRALERYSDDEFASATGRAAYDRYWQDPLTPQRYIGALESVYEEVLSGSVTLERQGAGSPMAVGQ